MKVVLEAFEGYIARVITARIGAQALLTLTLNPNPNPKPKPKPNPKP